jgi:high affinity Mn2+ porin
VRVWDQLEAYVNPEVDQGFGLSDTLGVAGFPSGEAYKIGMSAPYLRLPRAFVRYTLGPGGTQQPVASGLNQLAGTQSSDNVILTVGKYSVVDIFDINAYAHDPRSDFLNWSITMREPSITLLTPGATRMAAQSSGLNPGGRCGKGFSPCPRFRTASI